MQVVSGQLHRRRVHFEAPPSSRVSKEMKAFDAWSMKQARIPIVETRTAMAHLYFEISRGSPRRRAPNANHGSVASLVQPRRIALDASQLATADARTGRRGAGAEQQGQSISPIGIADTLAESTLTRRQPSIKRSEFYLAKAKVVLSGCVVRCTTDQDKAIARTFREGIDGLQRRPERRELQSPSSRSIACGRATRDSAGPRFKKRRSQRQES